ncbi:OmpA/MotB family protein [Gynuella sp.]|uniref:OmpA/MotB family protein n=1 Tax=Gynuella sp. TaxID=2969146 RepID=UPI003D12E81E
MIADDNLVVEQEEHWVSVSDLMAGLMMVFMLIAVVFMVEVELERKRIENVVVLYDRLRTQLYQDLVTEFKDDLERWGAEIDPDLSFRFYKAELLFDRGETDLKPEFSEILADFFPRYMRIIMSDKYRNDISEVRIEGHTSSMWAGRSADEAYILNMELSQSRTRSTLAYLLALDSVKDQADWLKAHLTANGLSSSKPVLNADGEESEALSRRVEFRVRTDADSRIAEILDEVDSETP